MSTAAPRLSRLTRWVAAAAALGLVLITATSRWLEPDPSGFGTHALLGLGPCGFLSLTGQRCPTCGMTTAFAWMARGRIDRAVEANPAGALLAPVCVALVPWLVLCAVSGRPRWGARSIEGPLIVVTVATVAVGLAAWTIRVILGRM